MSNKVLATASHTTTRVLDTTTTVVDSFAYIAVGMREQSKATGISMAVDARKEINDNLKDLNKTDQAEILALFE